MRLEWLPCCSKTKLIDFLTSTDALVSEVQTFTYLLLIVSLYPWIVYRCILPSSGFGASFTGISDTTSFPDHRPIWYTALESWNADVDHNKWMRATVKMYRENKISLSFSPFSLFHCESSHPPRLSIMRSRIFTAVASGACVRAALSKRDDGELFNLHTTHSHPCSLRCTASSPDSWVYEYTHTEDFMHPCATTLSSHYFRGLPSPSIHYLCLIHEPWLSICPHVDKQAYKPQK